MLPHSLIDKPHDVLPSLFLQKDGKAKDKKKQQLSKIPDIIKSGEIDILFGHPEAFLSTEGRELLKSSIFKERVVACAIDEAHCVEIWGNEFRTDFSELAVLKSFIPELQFLAVTATATKSQTKHFSETLCMKDLKIICVSPNRPNIFLSIVQRKPSLYGFVGIAEILEPIARNLLILKENFPMTVIYMKLDFCGKAYSLFDKILAENQYVNGEISCKTRLFNQFHSPSPPCEKNYILEEIKEIDSRTRVLFATTALGMGVDAPNISHVIHIGPPSSMEAYTQEIGRAGRTKCDSWATLFYNNSDIATNTHTEKAMRDYCLSEGCLRKVLTNYFDFYSPKQERCCSTCNPDTAFPYFELLEIRKRIADESTLEVFKEEIDKCFAKFDNEIKNGFYFTLI
ncbi:ATP-dependent DNA helicase RecQ-like [Clytia hemisphaerica]|uniref:ATP-dependent DNA helicase RecQ-like n=1 Tax=Clytia hemisphaerica TaxID=252671 RepID=UPI0034D57123